LKHTLVLTIGGVVVIASCSIVGDLDEFQADLNTPLPGSGGTGAGVATTVGPGGTGGDGGASTSSSGGSGGSVAGPCGGLDAVTYAVTPTIIPVRNACEIEEDVQGAVLLDANEAEAELPFGGVLPFDFCFYGEEQSHLWVGDNGYVVFSEDQPNKLQLDIGPPHTLGEVGVPQPAVMPLYDKLHTGAKGICYALTDDAPYRKLWITYHRACFGSAACGDNSILTFSVGLEETTNNIDFGYITMSGGTPSLQSQALGSTATIGIADGAAPACSAAKCSELGVCDDGEPCNYTEYNSEVVIEGGLPNLQFAPIAQTGPSNN